MFCTGCGKEIAESSEFCPNCGKKIGETSVVANDARLVKVVIHRKKSFYGAAVKMGVYVDGKELAKLKSDGSAEIMLAPGQHELIADMWSGTTKHFFDVPSDCSTVYVELGIKMGLITNKIKILSIRNEK